MSIVCLPRARNGDRVTGLRRALFVIAVGLVVAAWSPAARADELVSRIEAPELGGAAMTFLVFGPERGQLMCYVDGWSLWFGLYLACDGCEIEAPDCVLLSTLDAAVGGMRDKLGIDLPYAAFGDTRVVFDGISGGALLDLCRSFAATVAADEDAAALCIEPTP